MRPLELAYIRQMTAFAPFGLQGAVVRQPAADNLTQYKPAERNDEGSHLQKIAVRDLDNIEAVKMGEVKGMARRGPPHLPGPLLDLYRQE